MYNLKNIRTIRSYLTTDSCKLLVINLVISHLDYSNALYFGLPDRLLSKLQRVQNAAAKLILGLQKCDSSTAALKYLHWLPVRQRIVYKIAVLVYECLHGLAPPYLSRLLHIQIKRPGLRSSNSSATTLLIPFHKHKIFLDRSFAYSGPFVWNALPEGLRNCQSLHTFRKHLKTHLFRITFN